MPLLGGIFVSPCLRVHLALFKVRERQGVHSLLVIGPTECIVASRALGGRLLGEFSEFERFIRLLSLGEVDAMLFSAKAFLGSVSTTSAVLLYCGGHVSVGELHVRQQQAGRHTSGIRRDDGRQTGLRASSRFPSTVSSSARASCAGIKSALAARAAMNAVLAPARSLFAEAVSEEHLDLRYIGCCSAWSRSFSIALAG